MKKVLFSLLILSTTIVACSEKKVEKAPEDVMPLDSIAVDSLAVDSLAVDSLAVDTTAITE